MENHNIETVYTFEWDLPMHGQTQAQVSIDVLKDKIDEALRKGATHIEINSYEETDRCGDYLYTEYDFIFKKITKMTDKEIQLQKLEKELKEAESKKKQQEKKHKDQITKRQKEYNDALKLIQSYQQASDQPDFDSAEIDKKIDQIESKITELKTK